MHVQVVYVVGAVAVVGEAVATAAADLFLPELQEWKFVYVAKRLLPLEAVRETLTDECIMVKNIITFERLVFAFILPFAIVDVTWLNL